MKNFWSLALLIVLFSFPSCRKYDGLPELEIMLHDSWTQTPIAGAEVNLLEITGGFWISEYTIVETETTNEDGSCRFSRSRYREDVELTHADYYPKTELGSIDSEVAEQIRLSMNPETWLKITMQDTGMANPAVESIMIAGGGLNTAVYNVEDGDWVMRRPNVDRPDQELNIEVNGEVEYEYNVDIELLRFDTLDLIIQY